LQEVTPNVARFYIMAFTGDVEKTRAQYKDFAQGVKSSSLLSASQTKMNGKEVNGFMAASQKTAVPLDFVTIISGTAANAWHAVGTEPFGKVFYDQDGSAHERYDVDVEKGMVMVLRPDGWIGARFGLGDSGLVGEIEAYFKMFSRA
jgi:phenol 2-monooxygenase